MNIISWTVTQTILSPRMLNALFFILLSFYCTDSELFAQRLANPPADLIAQAKAIKAEYEESKIAATKRQRHVRFFQNKKTQNIGATVNMEEQFVALQGDYRHLVVQFFDETSAVTNIEAKNSKGKRQKLNINKSFYEQDGIFYSDAKVCYFPLHFDVQGRTYDVSLKKNYQDIRYFSSIYLSELFPIQETNLQFSIPRDLEIELAERNFEGFNIEKKTRFDAANNTDVITYTAKKLPPMHQEQRSKGPSHLYPHLLILPKTYKEADKKVSIFQSTQDLYNWYRSLIDLMENDKTAIQELSTKLTKDLQSDEEKIKAIYYWIQDNIRYIAFEDGIAGFKPDECQNVLSKKYGDCKGMANLTKELLIAAGFEAHLTWIGTKRLAYDYSTPCLAVDNHMICTVMLEGKKYYLDATEEFNQLGSYAERIQGQQVLIENGKDFILETIPLANYQDNTRHFKQELSLNDKNLTGTGIYTFEGESKANFVYDLNSYGKSYEKDALRYYITDGNKSYKISDMKASDISNRDADMRLSFGVNWENAIASFGDELYLNLDFEKTFSQSKFEDDRKQDYLFSHKIHQTTKVTLTLPKGYSVTYLPEAVKVEGEHFSFQVAYTQEDNQLIYTKSVAIPQAEIRKEDFEAWNAAIDQLNKIHNEQVVLTKG